MQRMSSTSSGFTIPELIIAIAVSAVLMGMVFGPLDDLYKSSSTGIRSITQLTNTRASLRRIEHNITLAAKFLPSNYNNISSSDNIPDTANSTSWNWQGSGSNSRVLITENYGTDNNGNAVLTAPTCDVTTPQTILYIYFVQNQSLYRRAVFASSYPSGCGGNVKNQQTCPPATSRPAACKANDALIATGVTYFSVDYYASASQSTAIDTGCGPGITNTYTHTCYNGGNNSPTPTSASTIVISITITTGTGVNAMSTSSQMRITRTNGTGT